MAYKIERIAPYEGSDNWLAVDGMVQPIVKMSFEGITGDDTLFDISFADDGDDPENRLKCYGTGASETEINEAVEGLHALLNDEDFAWPGRRNHDAVNLVIYLWVLGYFAYADGEVAWIDKFRKHVDDLGSNWDLFQEHLERVQPYAAEWGPLGAEGNALKYVV